MIAILADDLTSALDGAAPFAARGLAASVALHAAVAAPCNADVLSIDLDTRALPPSQAGQRFGDAARTVGTALVLYKTMDSTLRGHAGLETQATLEAAARTRAVVAPAFPAARRCTVNGRQLVDGVPVHLTAFARDPRSPVRSSRIDDAMAGADPARFSVHDAADDAALDALVARVGVDSPVLWVGSPGLAAALARAWPRRERPRAAVVLPPAGRVLVVVGSLHPANQAQIGALRQAGVPLVRMPADVDEASTGAALLHAFASHPVVCLASPRQRAGAPDAPEVFALRAGRLVRQCATCFDGLVATGGDTARRLVDALGASVLYLAGEVEPGVPVGALRLPYRTLPFATKAGGFGDASALLRCVGRLRRPHSF